MRKALNLLFLSSLLGGMVVVVTAETWNGLTPLRSTRHDVERKLGLPTEHGFYQLEEGKVRIFYGAGQPDSDTCWGRAPQDVVTSISVSLDREFPISSIPNRARLKLTPNSHHPDSSTYSDWIRGIQYHVGFDAGEVFDIIYQASKKDCDRLLKNKRISLNA